MRNLKSIIAFMAIITMNTTSCKKFVEVDPPKNSLVPTNVFKSNDLAISALLGIYQQMSSTDFACNGERSISTICGLTADELIGYNVQTYKPFYENQITAENTLLSSIWDSPFKRIYDANGILEGLASQTGVTPIVKMQLQGEAYFIRAFSYFYLVNLFGDVPLYLTTDYIKNSGATRAPKAEVYNQIISDLENAETLLGENYITTERVRPNKSTVQALLSRVYLYLGYWEKAEKYASLIIAKDDKYQLVNLDKVFLKNSLETIWQLMPAPNSNTVAGMFFVLTSAPVSVSLRQDFVKSSFEPNDLRKNIWIKSIVSSGVEYFYPYKYQVRSSTDVSEYSMVFRLAEQYLIRAEARVQQNNLVGSISDLDKLRGRAGIVLINNVNPNIDKESLLTLIGKERRSELFTEWGDRWFNLKRTNSLSSIMSIAKIGWKPNFELFPIRIAEINNNNNIIQNPGY